MYSEWTRPQKPMNRAARSNRRQSPTSVAWWRALREFIPRRRPSRRTASPKGSAASQGTRSASIADKARRRGRRGPTGSGRSLLEGALIEPLGAEPPAVLERPLRAVAPRAWRSRNFERRCWARPRSSTVSPRALQRSRTASSVRGQVIVSEDGRRNVSVHPWFSGTQLAAPPSLSMRSFRR